MDKETKPESELNLASLKNYNNFIWRIINWKLSSKTQNTRDLVYDEVIDGLLKAIKKGTVKAIHGDASVRSYIYRVIGNKVSDYFREITRDKKRLLREPIKPRSPEDRQWDLEYRQSVWEANDEPLTEDEVAKIFMKLDLIRKFRGANLKVAIRIIQGEKRKDIADELGLTIDQVRGKIQRVKKKLKDPMVNEAIKKIIEKKRWHNPPAWKKAKKKGVQLYRGS